MISSRLNKNNPLIFQVVLTVIYLVGMIGFSNPEWKEELQPTSGVILYISTFIMALASKNKLKFMVFMSIAFIIGFGTEAIGVNTGFLFGDYQYGSNLGPKFLNVSVVIGLLCGVLALSAASIVDRIVLFNKAKVFFSASASARDRAKVRPCRSSASNSAVMRTCRYWSTENNPTRNNASGSSIIAKIRAESGLMNEGQNRRLLATIQLSFIFAF